MLELKEAIGGTQMSEMLLWEVSTVETNSRE